MLFKMYIENYINQRVQEYQEPTRAGTPKGETIGLSKLKYCAALYVGITNYKPIEIVEKLGISSVGLLRKWKTETMFKAISNIGALQYLYTLDGGRSC